MTRNTESHKNRISPAQARRQLAERGITQGDVAARLGVTREHVCLCLNGRRHSRRLMAGIQRILDGVRA